MDNYKKYLEELIPSADKERVWLFFLAFSRFEYALKKSRFARIKKQKFANKPADESIIVEWDRFASEYQHAFKPDSNVRLRTAYDYFVSHPPEKQILKGSLLGSVESHPLGDNPPLCWLVTMLRRVRNNLFHGGKFPVLIRPISDTARDSQLIEHSLVILQACLALDSNVQHAFMESSE